MDKREISRNVFLSLMALFLMLFSAESNAYDWIDVDNRLNKMAENMEKYPHRIVVYSWCWEQHYAHKCDRKSRVMMYVMPDRSITISSPSDHINNINEQQFIEQVMSYNPAVFYDGACLDAACLHR